MRCLQRLPVVIALATALIPLIFVHVAWWWSTQLGLIPACNPYWHGCTSISAAMRNPPVVYLFRPVMLPWGWLLLAFWSLCALWAAQVHPTAVRRRWIMWLCGTVGAIFYLLYATWLGEEGELPRSLRRYGINLYFAMTVLAQMWLVSIAAAAGVLSQRLRHAFIALLAALLLLGLSSLPLQFIDGIDRRAMLNALEWIYALLMIACYPLTALAFLQSGFRASASVRAAQQR